MGSLDFYAIDKEQNKNYAKSLGIIATLSRLFSDNTTPYLHYRIMENLFCDCFGFENLSRSDTAYDARLNHLGVGLKTFICNSNASVEKVAEFNKDSAFLKHITDKRDLAEKLAHLRNERIESANKIYDIKNSVYHIIARQDKKLLFFETDYEKININNIQKIKNNDKSLSFYDGTNEYIFNHSKSVLQRKFYIPTNPHILEIEIANNPFELLLSLQDLQIKQHKEKIAGLDYVVLPLYSIKGGVKNVPEKSGLNQWNAGGRIRKYGEVYIPVPREIHKKYPNFFPPRDEIFTLITPNKEQLQAKLCQDNAKALMSNPNTNLAKWLLQTALHYKEGELATYERMLELGFDSVIITKESQSHFSIDIMPLDSYEKFISL
ncbi:restriction endonuclease [Helicobacter canis]|uniref:Restriction endonuclease n=2 Tax=Helicobacter canis TaxID=29419 RepID=A0A377J1V8_9HELI|nr:restriction endonuclease [Helicobacter canis]